MHQLDNVCLRNPAGGGCRHCCLFENRLALMWLPGQWRTRHKKVLSRQILVRLQPGEYRYSRHLPVVAAPIRCPQSLLVDFSVEQTREALHEIDAAWFLVARYFAARVIDQLHFARRAARPHLHTGLDRFTPYLVRDRNDRHIGNVRVGAQRLFDFPGVDVLPARDDHVLLAVDHIDELAAVDETEVLGMDPSITKDFRGQLRLVPIAAHDCRRAEQDFADLPGVARRAVFANDLDLVPKQRLTRRTQTTLAFRAAEKMFMRLEDGSDQAFGHPIDLHKYGAHPIKCAAKEGSRHRGGCVVHAPQGADVIQFCFEHIEQSLDHRRRKVRSGYSFLLDSIEDVFSIESGLEDHLCDHKIEINLIDL